MNKIITFMLGAMLALNGSAQQLAVLKDIETCYDDALNQSFATH